MNRNLVAALLFLGLAATLVFGIRTGLERIEAHRALRLIEQRTVGATATGRVVVPLLQENLRVIREISDLDPIEVGIPMTRGAQYLLMARPEAAIEAYLEAVELEKRPEAYLNLGRAYRLAGDERKTAQSFRRAYRLEPELHDQIPDQYLPAGRNRRRARRAAPPNESGGNENAESISNGSETGTGSSEASGTAGGQNDLDRSDEDGQVQP